jgi:Holliday junction resolvase RusA-like endonuclease
MKVYVFDIDPNPKPRMTRADRWKKRPIVNTYWAFKDLLTLQANRLGLKTLPGSIKSLIFVIPMSQSWSEKKKIKYDKTPHIQKPDLDNLLKALQDCLCKDDSHIWSIGKMSKVWGRKGQILITIEDT